MRSHQSARSRKVVLSLAAACALPAAVRANIYEWDQSYYASHGTFIQSTTLCPGGSGVSAAPSANLKSRDLSFAYLSSANLTSANLSNSVLIYAALNSANLSSANLASANLSGATLTGANLTNATVTAAYFSQAIGFTPAQLYSTASYVNHDIHGITLDGNDLTNWSFANQNLTAANFNVTTLTGANFTGATVIGTNFFGAAGFTAAQLYTTSSYASHDLHAIGLEGEDLSSWNLSNQNLTSANFYGSNLTNANLTNASIPMANFSLVTGLTPSQIYSTASYTNHDLHSVVFDGNDLTNWNLTGQNLSSTSFHQTLLAGANFTGATIANTDFFGADLRNATGLSTLPPQNAILPNGNLKVSLVQSHSLQLPLANPSLPSINITSLSIDSTSSLDIRDNRLPIHYSDSANRSAIIANLVTGYDAGLWDGLGINSSTAAADPAHLTTIGYLDDGSSLTLALTSYGDANLDGHIDSDDYALIDRSLAKHLPATWSNGDFNYDGTIDSNDYLLLDTSYGQAQGLSPGFLSQRQSQFGSAYVQSLISSVPEPTSLLTACGFALPLLTRRRTPKAN